MIATILLPLLIIAGGPKLNTKAKLKVRGSSVELVKYEADGDVLTVRRKAKRKVVNSQPLIYEEYFSLTASNGDILLQYVHEGTPKDKRYSIDKHSLIGKHKPILATFDALIEGYSESCIWAIPVGEFLDITDTGRFTIKAARKKLTVSLSKDDKEAMRWIVWDNFVGGEALLKKRYGKRYNKGG